MKHLKLLFIALILVAIPYCGGGNTAELPGTITLATAPVPPAQLKFGTQDQEEQVEMETKMTVETEETEDAVQLKVQDFEAEGEFPTQGPVKVKLNPEGDSDGVVYKLDENDQPLGRHHMQLDLVVEIDGQELQFNDVQLGGFTEEIGLEVEPQPIEYRTGDESVHVMKMPGLKKFTNIVLKRSGPGEFEPLPENP